MLEEFVSEAITPVPGTADARTMAAGATKSAMSTLAILPLIMAACYIGLIIYFKKKGGYKAIDLVAEDAPPE